MIRVSAYYPAKVGGQFDDAYFKLEHLNLLKARLLTFGVKRIELDKGLEGGDGGAAPFVAAEHLFFESLERFRKTFDLHGGDLLADISNYTNIEPKIQISEVIMLQTD